MESERAEQLPSPEEAAVAWLQAAVHELLGVRRPPTDATITVASNPIRPT